MAAKVFTSTAWPLGIKVWHFHFETPLAAALINGPKHHASGISFNGGALGLLSHKLSDCRHQTEIGDRFFKKSLGPSVATAPLMGKAVECG